MHYGSQSQAIGVAEEHLAILINQMVMNGELVLYPRCTPFYSSYEWITVDPPGAVLAQKVQSLTLLRTICFWLVPVATRRSSQRIPVIRKVAAAQHLLEYGLGIGFAACGP